MTTKVHSILARETVYAACASKNFMASMADFIDRYKKHPHAYSLLIEMTKIMAEIIDGAKAVGFTFSGDPRLKDSYAERMMRMLKHGGKPDRFYSDVLDETFFLLDVTNKLIQAGAVITPGKPAAPEPIHIRLEQPKPEKAEPMEVKVISMPTREKTTTVERDKNENIKKTTTVETDAAA
jgi:hypothetical protein